MAPALGSRATLSAPNLPAASSFDERQKRPVFAAMLVGSRVFALSAYNVGTDTCLVFVIVDKRPAMAAAASWAQRLVIGGGNGDRVGKLQDAVADSRVRGGARRQSPTTTRTNPMAPSANTNPPPRSQPKCYEGRYPACISTPD
ncbi:uncharacterized protein B0H64DRAFT_435023 [Chaetomium fimeti]|uniref:Uncharacterized protein n=1 Tax=Chaetomium fimeti TaxID=1854472 RepID=A0AAE0LNR2_9PEZI|nr:hypothetical protein B0H64DRAFT_435023 [Chaetomium fimeti]